MLNHSESEALVEDESDELSEDDDDESFLFFESSSGMSRLSLAKFEDACIVAGERRMFAEERRSSGCGDKDGECEMLRFLLPETV